MKSQIKKKMTMKAWYQRGGRRLVRTLKVVRSFRGLAQLGPSAQWHVDLKFVNRVVMTRLNLVYRQKEYPTDILSFPALDLFRDQGFLGELVICLPVLKSQARSFQQSSFLELDVLLIHGVLHLLGLDHERDGKQAARMARWEAQVLKGLSLQSISPRLGLIDRSTSGI